MGMDTFYCYASGFLCTKMCTVAFLPLYVAAGFIVDVDAARSNTARFLGADMRAVLPLHGLHVTAGLIVDMSTGLTL